MRAVNSAPDWSQVPVRSGFVPMGSNYRQASGKGIATCLSIGFWITLLTFDLRTNSKSRRRSLNAKGWNSIGSAFAGGAIFLSKQKEDIGRIGISPAHVGATQRTKLTSIIYSTLIVCYSRAQGVG
jgi:hypothetical protein